MKLFSCICGETSSLFFESTQCTTCGRLTGFCHDLKSVISFDPTEKEGIFVGAENGLEYQQCDNYRLHQTCNGMTPVINPKHEEATSNLCFSCHFNDNIPNLSIPQHITLWRKLETAKRRTLFTLDALELPLLDKTQDPQKGLSFDFLADKNATDHFATPIKGQDPVFTGHSNGHITINIAEADDVARASARLAMGERYRTLLGHFRHEIGHYYWDILVAPDKKQLTKCRALFGDDREDYQESIERHYEEGAPENWQNSYISEYATMHPWEDFAETWAHYLHMIDTLETAQEGGLELTKKSDKHSPEVSDLALPQEENYFNKRSSLTNIVNTWIRFSVVLNSLNRSMGLPDAYPFVYNETIVKKLQFIHTLIHNYDPTSMQVTPEHSKEKPEHAKNHIPSSDDAPLASGQPEKKDS